MPKQLKIPVELLQLNPNLSIREIRAIIMTVLKSRNNIIRQSHIFRIVIPYLGTFKSRGNKVPKRRKKTLIKDKKRKREKYRKEELLRDNLLF